MNKRQAKIDALNIAIDLIKLEIEEPSGLQQGYNPGDQAKVLDCLERIMLDLEDKRDEAAYTQYRIDCKRDRQLELKSL